MRQDRRAQSVEAAIVHVGAARAHRPQPTGDKLAVTGEVAGRTGGLVLIERLALGIGFCVLGARAHVVQLEISVGRHHVTPPASAPRRGPGRSASSRFTTTSWGASSELSVPGGL